MPAVNGSAARVCGDSCPQSRVRDSETDLFALHVPARLYSTNMLVHSSKKRVAASLSPIHDCDACQEQDRDCCPDCPTMGLRTCHSPQCVGQSRGDSKNREKLNEIGEGRRVLKRWALLALKKPPPFVPHSLMISCEATGPCAILCSVTVSIIGLPSGPITGLPSEPTFGTCCGRQTDDG